MPHLRDDVWCFPVQIPTCYCYSCTIQYSSLCLIQLFKFKWIELNESISVCLTPTFLSINEYVDIPVCHISPRSWINVISPLREDISPYARVEPNKSWLQKHTSRLNVVRRLTERGSDLADTSIWTFSMLGRHCLLSKVRKKRLQNVHGAMTPEG